MDEKRNEAMCAGIVDVLRNSDKANVNVTIGEVCIEVEQYSHGYEVQLQQQQDGVWRFWTVADHLKIDLVHDALKSALRMIESMPKQRKEKD